MTDPRETKLTLLFTESKTDATNDVMPDLLSFSYDDREADQADEISLTVKDEKGKWAGSWKPDGGETIRAYIKGSTCPKLFCGKFYVDSMRVSGSPRVCEIRAVSIPLKAPIRRRLVTKAWENYTLKGILKEIAAKAEIYFYFEVEEDPEYDRLDQKEESDLAFLSRLCQDAGLSIKVTDDTIVIFDQSRYEKMEPVCEVELGVSDVLSWDFQTTQSDTYKSCVVSWRDIKKKKRKSAGGYNLDLEKPSDKPPAKHNIDLEKIDDSNASKNPAVNTYVYVDPNADANGQEYKLKRRVTSRAEAERVAKATLRRLNLRSVTGSMTLVGDTRLVAGIVIEVKGFGSFDGNFFIESASHSMSESGYVTTINVRRVNNKY
nr:MAG TPA: tail protein [Caudoviricetes sp.]DAK71834.1 MAG TPA: tail protein [Caudoviricetes sp.]